MGRPRVHCSHKIFSGILLYREVPQHCGFLWSVEFCSAVKFCSAIEICCADEPCSAMEFGSAVEFCIAEEFCSTMEFCSVMEFCSGVAFCSAVEFCSDVEFCYLSRGSGKFSETCRPLFMSAVLNFWILWQLLLPLSEIKSCGVVPFF